MARGRKLTVKKPARPRGARAAARSVKRTTKETDIEVAVDLDGKGTSNISTGIGFFDHMLDLLARHSRIDITVKAKGDLHIDHHHTTEDVGIALGQAVKQALGDMKGITRYADVHVPMDEALTRVAIDVSGRPFLVFKAQFGRDKVGAFDTELVQEWFQAFAMNAGVTLHVETLYGSKRSPYCGIVLQGPGAGVARGLCDRSARRRRGALDQGLARRLTVASLSRDASRLRAAGGRNAGLYGARAAAARRRRRSRPSGPLRVRARRLLVLGVPVRAGLDALAPAVAGAAALHRGDGGAAGCAVGARRVRAR